MKNNKKQHTKIALIVGASGLVGEHLLTLLLASPRYSKVIVMVRQPLKFKHDKLEQWTVDFENLSQHLCNDDPIVNKSQSNNDCNEFTKIDHIYCTLGTTIKKAGSKQAFYRVDYDYPLAIAQHFHLHGASLFAIVSAIGANKSAKVFYNHVKGKIEASLTTIGYQHLGIFRPSMLTGKRNEYRLAEHIGSVFMNAFAFIIPKKYQVIEATKVANAMIAFADSPPQGTSIIQSDQLQNH